MKFCSPEQSSNTKGNTFNPLSSHSLPDQIQELPHGRIDLCLLFYSLSASVWGGRNGGEGVKGEGSVTTLRFRVQSPVSPAWSLNRTE